VVNAFEAILEGNAVRAVVAIATSSSNGWVEISVSDNGPGFPDDVMKNCFEPFVTTKPEGLGMGLPISRSIVEGHGGELVADANAEGGANLRILLPVYSGEDG